MKNSDMSLNKDSNPEIKAGKNAAVKAWRTIRERQRVRASKDSYQLEKFVGPSVVVNIKHPESVSENGLGPDVSFGRGIVSQFHKTPHDIACGRFWELRWAYGCPLDCNYCYLRGTMRGNMRPNVIRVEYVLAALDEAFARIKNPSIFNSGELSDSMMNPAVMAKIADKFESQSTHKLSTLSKFGPKNAQFLINKPRKQVICAWSVNAIEVAKKDRKSVV